MLTTLILLKYSQTLMVVANLENFNYRKGFGSIHALFVTPSRVTYHRSKGDCILG